MGNKSLFVRPGHICKIYRQYVYVIQWSRIQEASNKVSRHFRYAARLYQANLTMGGGGGKGIF